MWPAADVVLRDREVVEVLEAALDLDRFELVAERGVRVVAEARDRPEVREVRRQPELVARLAGDRRGFFEAGRRCVEITFADRDVPEQPDAPGRLVDVAQLAKECERLLEQRACACRIALP
jgi:hypothetical protein